MQVDHLGMLQNPDRWPMWPALPVKRKDSEIHNKNMGIVVADGKQLTVFICNVFAIPEDLNTVPRFDYKTHQELLADGWEVD